MTGETGRNTKFEQPVIAKLCHWLGLHTTGRPRPCSQGSPCRNRVKSVRANQKYVTDRIGRRDVGEFVSALALAVLAHSSLYLTRSYFSDGNKHHHNTIELMPSLPQ